MSGLLLCVVVALTGLSALQGVIKLILAISGCRRLRHGRPSMRGEVGPVTVVIPCYNEEKVLARTLTTVFGSTDIDLAVVVCIDDGSTDDTLGVMRSFRDEYGDRLVLLHQENRGKASALNAGLARVATPHFVSIDADTQVQPRSIRQLLERLSAGDVAAVSGQMLVGNLAPRTAAVTTAQVREYERANNIDRSLLSRLQVASVIPGAVGAFRTDAVMAVGGYPVGTLAEDSHLTFMLLAEGYGVAHEPRATVFTEAPDTLRGLFKQRRRWSTGKIQVSALILPSVLRSRAAVKAVWTHTAVSEAIMPLITPPLVLALPVYLLALAVNATSAEGRESAPLVLVAVIVSAVHLLVSLASSRFAGSVDAEVRSAAGISRASVTVSALLVLPVVRFLGVSAAWCDILLRRRKRWNSVDRTGDVRVVALDARSS